MTTETTIQADLSPLRACTICRDVQNFDLLIEDMETAMGECWGDLEFGEAIAFFGQAEADALEFVALAIDDSDEEKLVMLGEIIETAKAHKIKVILIAEDVSPASLHQLLRHGADEFVPYPLPEGELQAAINRLKTPQNLGQPVADPAPVAAAPRAQAGNRNGALFAVHGLGGGTGATTLATNLAWELANVGKTDHPKVCLIDLDLQLGAVSAYLDLPRREAVMEMLTDVDAMDDEVFQTALVGFEDKLSVLTAPNEMLPLDIMSPDDISALLNMAKSHFDYVIVDMPSTVVQWTETVLRAAQIYFATVELDMRSAENALRFKRALLAEELPVERLRYALNRAPKFTDLNGKNRAKLMAENLGIALELQLPDGGKPVSQGADHGQPLAMSAAKNPLRKEIAKLAASLHELGQSQAEAA
ncbi:MAG: pilus assembly protein CpaE [Rhodobacterales bacterium]|nr:MAG: pilus assembly protein CpaE [Rhodobacterales bacterium]